MKKILGVLALIPVVALGDTRIIQTDAYGNKQYHKPQYILKGDKVYETDSIGNVQYHKPSYDVLGHRDSATPRNQKAQVNQNTKSSKRRDK